ncbi:hypothetical protein CXB36_03860 [Pseudomonas syringae pv. syringae]|nr:hypothetical protein BKC06_004030 [Pseudomonas syringae pv. syringae]POP68058.1 hypothetical protein CXB36_03860 [Pseudomonas syringae pv. syringae]POP91876.1 hypothetical protein CXB41_24400 [Pseudomonas syringae pv. syringae]PYD13365.1 hypothetical protein DND47_19985 [Pseudomonas syringae pv. syringae]RMR53860.1 hypothetical protein ALP85_200029 [Pseudomonas syringae pv. syringae]
MRSSKLGGMLLSYPDSDDVDLWGWGRLTFRACRTPSQIEGKKPIVVGAVIWFCSFTKSYLA